MKKLKKLFVIPVLLFVTGCKKTESESQSLKDEINHSLNCPDALLDASECTFDGVGKVTTIYQKNNILVTASDANGNVIIKTVNYSSKPDEIRSQFEEVDDETVQSVIDEQGENEEVVEQEKADAAEETIVSTPDSLIEATPTPMPQVVYTPTPTPYIPPAPAVDYCEYTYTELDDYGNVLSTRTEVKPCE